MTGPEAQECKPNTLSLSLSLSHMTEPCRDACHRPRRRASRRARARAPHRRRRHPPPGLLPPPSLPTPLLPPAHSSATGEASPRLFRGRRTWARAAGLPIAAAISATAGGHPLSAALRRRLAGEALGPRPLLLGSGHHLQSRGRGHQKTTINSTFYSIVIIDIFIRHLSSKINRPASVLKHHSSNTSPASCAGATTWNFRLG